MQHGTQQVGKNFPSWHDFISALTKQFYPLGYKEKVLNEWKSLNLIKGQSVQEYTYEFRNMALMSDVLLTTQETHIKYIGSFTAYICNDVSVQETYIETWKNGVSVWGESSSKKYGKRKGNGKKANSTTIKEEKLSYKHWKKEGHDDEHCWKL